MWGNKSKDHQKNPFTAQTIQIKGLSNLNPFGKKKKKKKEKWSIKVVDGKSSNKKKATKKKTSKSTKSRSGTKPRSTTKPKTNPKSTPQKPKPTHSKSASKTNARSNPKKLNKSQSYDNHNHNPRTGHISHSQSSSISTERCINPSVRGQHKKSQSVQKRPKTQPQYNQSRSNETEDSQDTTASYAPSNHNSEQSHSTHSEQPTKSKKKSKSKRVEAQRSQRTDSSSSKPKTHVSVSEATYSRNRPKAARNKKATVPKKSSKTYKNKTQSSKKKKNKRKKEVSESESEEEDDEDDKRKKKKKKNRQNKQDSEFRSRLEADIIDEKPDISFRDVQGLEAVKLALYETIILPNLRPELFTGLRAPTAGLLLFGPPGNGKTMIAKCVAAECDGTFFSISASSITSKFVGDAERIMRTLFDLARDKAPSIIFIDEIDSLLTARGGKNEAESSRRIKTEFLIQFDGVKKASDAEKRVLVIGATNLPDQLDEAVLRRFGKRIMVPLPDDDTRKGLLTLLMAKQRNNLMEQDFMHVVSKTEGYSCSDLATLCKDASMGPIRDLGAKIIEIESVDDMPFIETKHFDAALDNVKPSLPESSLKYFIEWNDKYGSKIHLSLSALPDNMRPYTDEELQKMTEEANANANDDSDGDNDDDDDYDDDEKSD